MIHFNLFHKHINFLPKNWHKYLYIRDADLGRFGFARYVRFNDVFIKDAMYFFRSFGNRSKYSWRTAANSDAEGVSIS